MVTTTVNALADTAGPNCAYPGKSDSGVSDCIRGCNVIISAAKVEIADLTKLTQDQDKTISDLQTSLNTVSADRDSDRKSLDAWFHNPFILIGAGLLIGGAGVLYLNGK
jgi:hypothetical protein